MHRLLRRPRHARDRWADRPIGVAILAYACCRADKQVVVVADGRNAHLVREALIILDPGCLKHIAIESVPAYGLAGMGEVRNVLDTHHLISILHKHEIDAMVHIEVPGRNKEGAYLNMRGIPISDFNAPLDDLMNFANSLLLNTVGVGDGGNEAGMGGMSGVPAALNGQDMQAVVPAAHQVIAWNSNLGAIALGEFVLAAAGKDASCTPAAFESMVRTMFKLGAVDGVTRKAGLDERMENPACRVTTTTPAWMVRAAQSTSAICCNCRTLRITCRSNGPTLAIIILNRTDTHCL
ncbi:MAG: glutamate cyclase domain-containing protein [Noviherbaspirillum sp.]